MRRPVRLLLHSLGLAALSVLAFAALRYLVDAISRDGVSPRALFGLLLSAAALALVRQSFLRVRRIVRRIRA